MRNSIVSHLIGTNSAYAWQNPSVAPGARDLSSTIPNSPSRQEQKVSDPPVTDSSVRAVKEVVSVDSTAQASVAESASIAQNAHKAVTVANKASKKVVKGKGANYNPIHAPLSQPASQLQPPPVYPAVVSSPPPSSFFYLWYGQEREVTNQLEEPGGRP